MEIKSLRNILISSLIVYLIYKLRNVLTPFFIALFIAYLTNPIITFIETKLKIKKRGVSRFIFNIFNLTCFIMHQTIVSKETLGELHHRYQV